RRCSGVWIYLRYVLDELRFGLRRPDEIGDLPSGLRNYYADQIRRWRKEQSLRRTLARRPDLLEKADLDDEAREILRRIENESK
ncbi:MAG: hypothetical protein ACXV5L_07795, partial [Thermoanaerobaculia bacterium]